jgi:phosphoglycerate kinase
MNYNKRSVTDVDLHGKRVLLRCDFNVPLDPETGRITSDTRIRATLPTIEYILEQGASVVACSHLGKPKGVVKPELSLEPVAVRLSALLERPVIFAKDAVGPDAQAKAAALKPGEVLLLENLRFDIREEKNDPEFARELAYLGDIFVDDAFGTVHRAHASTAGVAAYLPAYAGLLLEKELSVMGKALDVPSRPLVSILGGAKISDKLGVISNLLDKADTLLIGGGMAFTFIKALGGSVGRSLVDESKIDYCMDMIKKALTKGTRFLLPIDAVAAKEISADAEWKIFPADRIPDDYMGLDIGPETRRLFAEAVSGAGTVIWNGPMGVFEYPAFAEGTAAVAKAMVETEAVTIVGGGDSASALEHLGFASRVTHVSTGGGASLEFMEGKELPGIACLLDR